MNQPFAAVGRTARILVLAATACVPAALAQSFTIVGACVFDGEHLLPAGTEVRVERGLILAVGPRLGLARGATVIDARGKTLLPGVIEPRARQPAREAQRLAQTGAAPEQALRAITATAALAQAAPEHPAIVTGARADFSLLEGDAAEGLEALSDIVAVWRHGFLVHGTRQARPSM